MGTAPTLIPFPFFLCLCRRAARRRGREHAEEPPQEGLREHRGLGTASLGSQGQPRLRRAAAGPSSFLPVLVPVPSCLSRRACPRCSGCVLVSRCMRAQGARRVFLDAARCDSAFCCRPVRVPRSTLRPMWPVVPPLRRPAPFHARHRCRFVPGFLIERTLNGSEHAWPLEERRRCDLKR